MHTIRQITKSSMVMVVIWQILHNIGILSFIKSQFLFFVVYHYKIRIYQNQGISCCSLTNYHQILHTLPFFSYVSVCMMHFCRSQFNDPKNKKQPVKKFPNFKYRLECVHSSIAFGNLNYKHTVVLNSIQSSEIIIPIWFYI